MPSEDKFHQESPETNAWLASEGLIPKFSTPLASSLALRRARATSRTAENAAHVQALAAKLGVDAEELAAKIPDDTLRRLKFPMIEQLDSEGRSVFKHDIGVVRDTRTPLLAVDRAYDAIEKGSAGKGAGTPQPRSADGKFSK